jgi:hypothetical protein
MKLRATVAMLLISTAFLHAAGILEKAVMELPPQALGGMPFTDRHVFLTWFQDDVPKNKRLDIENDYLNFYTDGDVPFHCSSEFYLKLFWIKTGGCIVFTYTKNPKALYVYKKQNGIWTDVTQKYLPPKALAYSEVQPCRYKRLIEFGVDKPRPNGYTDAIRQLDLRWSGTSFEMLAPPTKKFTDDGL